MFIIPQDITAISAMGVLNYSCAPMTRRNMRDGNAEMAQTVPPVQFDNLSKTQVSDKIEHVARYDDGRRGTPSRSRVLYKGTQRGTMEMIEMRMSDQHQIDRR